MSHSASFPALWAQPAMPTLFAHHRWANARNVDPTVNQRWVVSPEQEQSVITKRWFMIIVTRRRHDPPFDCNTIVRLFYHRATWEKIIIMIMAASESWIFIVHVKHWIHGSESGIFIVNLKHWIHDTVCSAYRHNNGVLRDFQCNG